MDPYYPNAAAAGAPAPPQQYPYYPPPQQYPQQMQQAYYPPPAPPQVWMQPHAGLQPHVMAGAAPPFQPQYAGLNPHPVAPMPQPAPPQAPPSQSAILPPSMGSVPHAGLEFNPQPSAAQPQVPLTETHAAAPPPALPAPAPPPVPAPAEAALPYRGVHVVGRLSGLGAVADLGGPRARKPSVKVMNDDFAVENGLSPRQLKAEQERAAALAAKKAAKEAAREEAERQRAEEEKNWSFAEGVEVTPDMQSMLRILYELFQKKHESYGAPFTNSEEATALDLQPCLVDVRRSLVAGEYTSIGPFAAAVRDVFARCYAQYGHPDRNALSKRCERIDAVFEQNITLLPRALRDAASLVAAPTTVLAGVGGGDAPSTSGGAEDAGERRSSARRQSQVQVVSTLRLIETRKLVEAQAMEVEKARAMREKRERALAAAEEWAASEVDEASLQRLRESYDGASLCHFLACFHAVMELPVSFSLIELELGLVHFPEASAMLRWCVEGLLRHSSFPNGKMAPMHKGPLPPSCASLSASLASRTFNWGRYLEMVLDKEARGEMVAENEPWLHEFQEGWGMREIIDRLERTSSEQTSVDRLKEIELTLREGGLSALDVPSRVGILHVLCESMLCEDKDIWKRMEPNEIEAARGEVLGKDAQGKWHFHLPPLEARVYSMSSPWRPKPLPEVPHMVRVGERIEVEVEEVKGQVEWRSAKVIELLKGGKGRFAVIVDGADGQPDEDFIETFASPLEGKEWRKVVKADKQKKAAEKAAAAAIPGERETRVSGRAKQPVVPPPPPAAPAAAKKAKQQEDKAKLVEALSTAEDGKTLALMEPKAALKALKGSKSKLDQSLHKAIGALGEAQEAHAQQASRLWQNAVVRLHDQVQNLSREAEAEAAAMAARAAAEAEVVQVEEARQVQVRVQVEEESYGTVRDRTKDAERQAAREARSLKRQRVAEEERLAAEAAESEAKAEAKAARVGDASAGLADGASPPPAPTEEPSPMAADAGEEAGAVEAAEAAAAAVEAAAAAAAAAAPAAAAPASVGSNGDVEAAQAPVTVMADDEMQG